MGDSWNVSWKAPSARSLGFPDYPVDSVFNPSGKVIPWIPYMRTDLDADWFCIMRVKHELRSYLESGGDPSKVIVHHMSYDPGVIDPLWSAKYFDKWCDQLHEWGIRHIWPPDFSTWLEWPMALHIYNLYRSSVVASDFAKKGFRILPYYYMAPPQTLDLMFSARPSKVHTAVIDGSHTSTAPINEKLFRRFAREFSDRVEAKRVLVWARTRKSAKIWSEETGKPCEWLRNRMYARSILMKAMNQKPST